MKKNNTYKLSHLFLSIIICLMPLIAMAQTMQLPHLEDLNFPNSDLPQYDVDLGHFPGDIIYCEDVNKVYIQCSDCVGAA
ncbi:MAG: hypothetical protein U5Q03_12995 [Bacteroidota bacterium]|nr:hypothetical protein [Bacteroidota bacterium]